jgi:hypothetical protein
MWNRERLVRRARSAGGAALLMPDSSPAICSGAVTTQPAEHHAPEKWLGVGTRLTSSGTGA